MLKTSTAQLDQDEISMQTSSRCDETRGVGWSECRLDGWSIGWKQKNDLVPIPHTLKGIQYQFLLQSYQNSSPTFVILGIGIPTFGERRGFCFKREGWYFGT